MPSGGLLEKICPWSQRKPFASGFMGFRWASCDFVGILFSLIDPWWAFLFLYFYAKVYSFFDDLTQKNTEGRVSRCRGQERGGTLQTVKS